MGSVLRFTRHLGVQTVAGDGVYVFSEGSRRTRLHGGLMERLAPFLLTGRSRGDISAALANDFDSDRLDSALARLVDAGLVVECDPEVDPRAGGYWELCGLDGDAAVARLRDRTVDVVGIGQVIDAEFAAAAMALGLQVGPGSPDLRVVLTDDYLRPELADHNRARLTDGGAWMPAKPVGSTVWIGPVFEPGRTGCWRCLSTYLESNQLVRSYLRQRTDAAGPPVAAEIGLPATRQLAAHMAALHAAQWLTGAEVGADRPSAPHTVMFTFDTIGWQWSRHVVRARPQCPECGDPDLQRRLQWDPVQLVSRPKIFTTDGGHRAKTPEALLAEYGSLISPITGPVTELVPSSAADDLFAYRAGANAAMSMTDISALHAGLRQSAGGKGMTDTQAKASALAEAIERFSGVYCGDEATVTARMDELDGAAIHPNSLQLYSDRQFAERAAWNAKKIPYQRVCDPFDPDDRIEWTPVWSLTHNATRYLPTANLFYDYPQQAGRFAFADSNGNAAGGCLEDAVLQGFLELVERDSVALWWYNRIQRPGIDLSGFDEPYFQRWQHRYRSLGREAWALDLTSDLGIPAVVALSRRIGAPREDILMGFGAHFDVKIAISRALTESNQFLGYDSTPVEDLTPELREWYTEATLDNQPYLVPADEPSRTSADYHDPSTDDLAEDVRLAQRIVENSGLEMLVLDQTRPDIGLPVVKVIVPGLRHFWTRYAPGRLYEVPVRMGWLPEPTPESELNPIGMFL
ncbi:goadsporin biosynthetic protein [Nocardia panacis]|uniref:Goadsporin biosynthetic protein n=1 Tax=Nocardia panacis TaxID=2340916 RepID=A0A3A4KQK7_9NOCA|nr:TOMM precursor leader peptide-binding protein [Nocardia panacis]RJO78311.1 goadsporin biosynthetic protein [Nocardia panacis]